MGVKTYDALEIPDDIRTQLFMNRTRYPLPFAVGPKNGKAASHLNSQA